MANAKNDACLTRPTDLAKLCWYVGIICVTHRFDACWSDSGGLDVPICEDDDVGTYILRTCGRLSSDAVEGQGVMLPMQPREAGPAVHGYAILTA